MTTKNPMTITFVPGDDQILKDISLDSFHASMFLYRFYPISKPLNFIYFIQFNFSSGINSGLNRML